MRKVWPWLGLVALLAVIFAVALPSYGDYTHRAQSSEAVLFLSNAKTPLAEHFADRGQWPPSLQALKLDTSGKFTRDIVISKGAGGKGEIELTATMRSEGVDRRVAGKSVTLASKDGGQTWLCRAGTIDVKHVPPACRPEGK